MKTSYYVILLFLAFVLLGETVSQAQYSINEKIDAEDLWENRALIPEQPNGQKNYDWLRIGHGEGWADHPSDFLYAVCGNRHWLCDYRTVPRCMDKCADSYVEVPIIVPEDGDYVIYAYVADWADSAVIEENAGCNRTDKWECSAWFLVWDDVGLLDKVQAGDYWNVSKEYIWKVYPHNTFCDSFALDTVALGYERMDCPGGDPRECDFPGTRFNLTAGEHTLYIKVAEEYTLLDWIWVAKDGDPPPAPEPGRSWQTEVKNTVVYQPKGFILDQNYPNPFNAETIIRYFLPRTSMVKLTIYNIEGQEVSILVNSQQPRGQHFAVFDAGKLPSGTYIYKLEAICTTCGGDKRTLYSEGKDMILVK